MADRGFVSICYRPPGGIGAAPVVAISGDGGFNMMPGELETARRTLWPLTIIVVNNVASGSLSGLGGQGRSRFGEKKLQRKGNGAQGRNRTTDTAIFSRMLYQLSYLGP